MERHVSSVGLWSRFLVNDLYVTESGQCRQQWALLMAEGKSGLTMSNQRPKMFAHYITVVHIIV